MQFHSISIIIPVYNEARTVRDIARRVLAADVLGLQKEVIIVDDGSSDGTEAILALLSKHPAIRVFREEKNRGKGAALRRGFAEARGDILFVQDADLEYSPEEYPLLLEPLLAGTADVVYGSRFLSRSNRDAFFFRQWLANRALTSLSNLLTGLRLSDMETCYKAFRRDLLPRINLREDRFGFEVEFTMKMAKIPEIRFREVSISYKGRRYAEGKKINWKDGVRALWSIVRYSAGA